MQDKRVFRNVPTIDKEKKFKICRHKKIEKCKTPQIHAQIHTYRDKRFIDIMENNWNMHLQFELICGKRDMRICWYKHRDGGWQCIIALYRNRFFYFITSSFP